MHYELAQEKMEGTLKSLSNELSKVRTGRASTSILDDVNVDYYGAPTPINQVAGLSIVEGTQIVVKPYDQTFLKEIEKAIHQTDLGLNPVNDGSVVRINIPPLTEEVRKNVVKDVEKIGKESKIAIRNIRRDANSEISKNDEFSEDDVFNEQKRIQDLTDAHVKKIDDLIKVKSAEVMTI